MHIARNCPKKVANTAMVQGGRSTERMRKTVLMNGKELIGCIDTLSDITLCTETTAQLFDEVEENASVGYRVVGGILHISKKSFVATIIIADFYFNTVVVVVPDDHIPVPLIIGNNVLSQMAFSVDANGFKIISRMDENDILKIFVELEVNQEPAEEIETLHVRDKSPIPVITGMIKYYFPGKTKERAIQMSIRYPLPSKEDQIDRLRGSQVYSTLDLKDGFFHIRVNENSKKYTVALSAETCQ